MKRSGFPRLLVFTLLIALSIPASAAPREAAWKKVEEAIGNDQPQTAIRLLKPLESAAFAAKAWGEGTKALAMRLTLEGKSTNDAATRINDLAEEIATAPVAARPLLRLLHTRWLAAYCEDQGWRLSERSPSTDTTDTDIRTWDKSRLLREIDRCFEASLADKPILQQTPVAGFNALLDPGELGDKLRPTLYDFIAHSALQYNSNSALQYLFWEHPQGAFEITANSPAFDAADAFLAWKPQSPDQNAPQLRVFRLYQDILTFHKADKDPTAFLHCDLERIRWVGKAATGPQAPARLDAALRAFIEANAKHPISAAARQDVADTLYKNNKTKEAHAIAKAGADAYPGHPYGKLCQNIVNFLEAKHLAIKSETHWTSSGEKITLEHANVSHVWFRAIRRDWAPGNDTLLRDPAPENLQEAKVLLEQKPAFAWNTALPDDKDFRIRISSLVAPVQLAPGYYIIIASANGDFTPNDNQISWLPVRVTTLALVLNSYAGNKLEGCVTNALSGAPQGGTRVVMWSKGKDSLDTTTSSATTDADGHFILTVISKGAEFSFLLVAGEHENQSICRSYLRDREPSPSQRSGENLVFLTDRPVYRPGQTVHFKGVWSARDLIKNNTRIVAGKAATVTFSGYNDKPIDKLDVVTNEFGSFSGSFTAPTGGRSGEYGISVKDVGATSVHVEEYKRPKFRVELKPPANPVTPGEFVEVIGHAANYTSGSGDGAKVAWRVTRSSYLEGSEWLQPHPPRRDKEIANGTDTTAADGSFRIRFPAEPDPNIGPEMNPVYTYEVNADVTEPAGETISASSEVRVAYATLEADLTTESWLEVGKPVVFRVLTHSHADHGRPAVGVLRIYQLKQPAPSLNGGIQNIDGYHEFDRDAGDTIDTDKWELGAMVREIPVSTGKEQSDMAGKADISTPLPAGIYRAVFTAKDANGREARATHGFQVIDLSSDKFPTPIPFFAVVTKLEPGQPISVLWGSGYPTARACVEFYRDKTLLKREWSAPNRTQQVFQFTPDESMRGGIGVLVYQSSKNRARKLAKTLEIPWNNKDLKLNWEHLTSKLAPGAKDTWTAVVTAPNGHPANVEMMASLYDASLNAIARYDFPSLESLGRLQSGYSRTASLNPATVMFKKGSDWQPKVRFGFKSPYRKYARMTDASTRDSKADQNVWGFGDDLPDSRGKMRDSGSGYLAACLMAKSDPSLSGTLQQVTARKNLQETAFFYPHLTSNDKGEVRITFTMPEALTQWKFIGFAHDKDMRTGTLVGETITAKDLMVQPNPPRFLREGDALDFTVKITNQSDKEQSGIARLTFADGTTQKDVTAALGIAASDQPWTVPAKESRTLAWHLAVPDGSGFLTYKALATSGTLSDGEEGWLPVIPRRVLLTESMALPVRDAGTKDFTFPKLLDSGKSTTLENRSVQVQVVSQPAWYAVLALPYLMEFPHECAEQTFNRYYANALARHLATTHPKIRQIFDLWKNTPALDSPLTKNIDLKGILLEETPWLNEADDQSQARRKLGFLFDDSQLGEQLDLTLKQLRQMQDPSGQWPWFPGGQGNEYISLYIATGFARLRALGVKTDITPALNALSQLDANLTNRITAIKHAAKKDPQSLKANHLDSQVAHHLYARTFFLKDRAVAPADKEAFEYFAAQAKQYWPSLDSRMSRSHAALALDRLGENATARLITRSLREHAVSNEDTGMSWQDAEGDERWHWWQAPIETQAMMIEAFREIDHDAKAVAACQVWLIKQLQVRNWHTTKATADAIHALLADATDLLGSDAQLQVSLGGTPVKPDGVEPGTGFYEARFAGPAIKPEMGAIQVTKTDPGVAWASVHWQYLEDLAKVTGHNATPLKLEKGLFVRKNTPEGPKLEPVSGPVNVGDELVTRLVLRNDRAMEFVHLKDQRGSGTEPVNVLSGYHWQDGLGYYEVTRDTASHFFIDTLPAGTHVFETSVRVQHAGTYQTGVAEIRCMYAPEFSAHSASIRLEVTP